MAYFLLGNSNIPLLIKSLDNIPETPTNISAMVPGVVILTLDFSSKLLFAGKLVILRKNDELLLHKEFLSLCHIRCILSLCIRDL